VQPVPRPGAGVGRRDPPVLHRERYHVTFPLLAKQDVNGAGRSPLYQWLVGSEAGGGADIHWNFEKFLVDRKGAVVARFAPDVAPDDPKVVAAVEAALG
jgi:glutathione peroxidase-family protein